MSIRPKLQNIKKRNWQELRDAWLSSVPNFPSIGATPDPGIERLPAFLSMQAPKTSERHEDIDGLRRHALWEAVYLFHKCSHAKLAVQRLGRQGMHSWSMFNAYHAAYLGARGIMAALGVELIIINGAQVLLDLFPEREKKRSLSKITNQGFSEFVAVPLPPIDQRQLWECFQRVLRMSDVACWNSELSKDIEDLAYERITPPRNHFLYRAYYWPLDDLTKDRPPGSLNVLLDTELDTETSGFLLRLCFSVYRLFDTLMVDLAKQSGVIREQIDGSRCHVDPDLDELAPYREFLERLAEKD